jgi:hypothetical protein
VRGSSSMTGMLGEGETGGSRWTPGAGAKRTDGTERGRGGAEAVTQRARTGVEAAWMGLGGAALELKDRRLGVDSSSGS